MVLPLFDCLPQPAHGGSPAYVIGGPLSAFFINTVGWRTAYLLLGGWVWFVVIPASLFMRAPPAGDGPQPRSAQRAASPLRLPSSAAMAGVTLREALADRRLWCLGVTWFLLGFANMMPAIHMVPYVKDQGVSLECAALALTVYGLSSIGGRLLFGAAADRLGTRPTFWFCLALQLVTLLAVLLKPSLWILYFLIMWFGLTAAGGDTAVAVRRRPGTSSGRLYLRCHGFLHLCLRPRFRRIGGEPRLFHPEHAATARDAVGQACWSLA